MSSFRSSIDKNRLTEKTCVLLPILVWRVCWRLFRGDQHCFVRMRRPAMERVLERLQVPREFSSTDITANLYATEASSVLVTLVFGLSIDYG